MLGDQVTTLRELRRAVGNKRSVICPMLPPPWNKPRSAAFMINLCGAVLLRLFKQGMYLYVKPEKKGE